MVPAGSFVTVRLSGEANTHPEALRSAVSSALQGLGLRVVAFDLSGPVVGSLLANPWLKYTYEGTVSVQTPIDYAQAADVTSLVNHAFYDQTGTLPAASSETVSANAPAVTTDPGWLASIGAGITGFFSGVQTDTQLVIFGLIAVLLVLVIYVGPTAVKALV